MVDVLQKHPMAISMGVLGWLAWSGLGTEPEAKGLSLDELPLIEADFVRVRPVDDALVVVRDPFPKLLSPEDFSPEYAPDVVEDDEEQEPEEQPLVPRIVVERRPRFLLELDSIMALGGSGHALINGRNIHVGEPIPGCDRDAPPVLEALSGLVATIEHRGALHELHLDLKPSLLLGGELFRRVILPGAQGEEPLVLEELVGPGAQADGAPRDAGADP